MRSAASAPLSSFLFGIIGCIDPSSQHPSRLPSCPVPRHRHPFLCYSTQYDSRVLSTENISTSIERRYCTNINARIQSLRIAAPALQVLKWNDGPKKSKGTTTMKKTRQVSYTSDDTLVASKWQGSAAKPTSWERLLSTFECLRRGRCD